MYLYIMIDKGTIEKIFDAADIYEIVSGFVNLKKRGVNYVGLCPFHNEKTGSFTVSPAKGIYKCFGCGKGGNSVNFIMEHEQISYIEALKFLAGKYNIPIEERELSEDEKRERSDRESMLIVTSYAQEFFKHQLIDTDEGRSVGLGYLHYRGISDEMIEKFEIGYNPEAWDLFTKSATEKGYKREFLVKTGLTIENERGAFDRFRARIIFPIKDIAGKVIAFGGRTMSNDKKIAKYVNSPESEIYHKSKTLYGIYLAKKSIIQNDKCILVEGYTDVISFHAKGVENVVASSGTSLTVEQIRLIRRLTSNITIIYDGDPAGIKASLRGIDLILEEGINVRVVMLPEGEDPDSFAKAGTPRELSEYLSHNEVDFISFKRSILLKTADTDPLQRAQLITDIVRSIAKIPDNIIRSVYVRESAQQLDVEERILYAEINKIRLKRGEGIPIAPKKSSSKPQISDNVRGVIPCEIEETVLIRYLIMFGITELYKEAESDRSVSVGEFIIRELEEDDLSLLNPLYDEIREEYKDAQSDNSFNPALHFIVHPDIRISNIVANILSEPYELSKIWNRLDNHVETEEMKLMELLPKVLDNYKMKRVEMLTREADNKILELQNSGDNEEIMEWLQKKSVIDKIRTKLNLKLGRTGY